MVGEDLTGPDTRDQAELNRSENNLCVLPAVQFDPAGFTPDLPFQIG